MKWAIGLVLLVGGCAGQSANPGPHPGAGPWGDFYNQPRSGDIPREVRAFVIKAQGCTHFSGEEGYDADRAAFLKARIDNLCPGVLRERTRLLAKYAGDPAVRALIAEVTEGYSF